MAKRTAVELNELLLRANGNMSQKLESKGAKIREGQFAQDYFAPFSLTPQSNFIYLLEDSLSSNSQKQAAADELARRVDDYLKQDGVFEIGLWNDVWA